jgi:hypothetical protein
MAIKGCAVSEMLAIACRLTQAAQCSHSLPATKKYLGPAHAGAKSNAPILKVLFLVSDAFIFNHLLHQHLLAYCSFYNLTMHLQGFNAISHSRVRSIDLATDMLLGGRSGGRNSEHNSRLQHHSNHSQH